MLKKKKQQRVLEIVLALLVRVVIGVGLGIMIVVVAPKDWLYQYMKLEQAKRAESITLEQVQEIQNIDHGDTMEEFIANVTDDDFETIGFFNQDGTKIAEWSDFERSSVIIPDLMHDYLTGHCNDVIKVHNHPDDTSFSEADYISFGSNNYAIETIVVTEDFLFHVKKAERQVILVSESEAFLDDCKQNGDGEELSIRSFIKDGRVIVPVVSKFEDAYVEHFGMTYWIEPRGEIRLLGD